MNRKGWTILFPALFFLMFTGGTALAGPVVLVDQGHGQRFTVEGEGPLQLSALAESLRTAGLEVRTASSPLSGETLTAVQAVLISGPFQGFSPEEVSALARFVEDGGRLAVMLHIGPPALSLLQHFGVDVANGVVRQQEDQIDGQPLDFYVTDLEPHPLTAGLDRFAVFGSWALRGYADHVRTLARSQPSAWVDLDGDRQLGPADAVQPFAIAVTGKVGRGEFVVFADDAIFQNRFLADYNRSLARNLARWLAGD